MSEVIRRLVAGPIPGSPAAHFGFGFGLRHDVQPSSLTFQPVIPLPLRGLAQYEDQPLVLQAELGFSKALGRSTLELLPSLTFFTDNNDSPGGKHLTQDPSSPSRDTSSITTTETRLLIAYSF